MRLVGWAGCGLLVLGTAVGGMGGERQVARPLPDHPGNVYLVDETVTVPIAEGTTHWKASDLEGQVVGQGQVDSDDKRIQLGELPIGWYRIDMGTAADTSATWTTAAVIARPQVSTPMDSPVCVDSATSWFSRHYPGEEQAKQKAFANLAALAGVNWIRDRLSWGQIETEPGQFAPRTLYDSSAELQAEQDLQVLQVFHSIPDWATDSQLDGSNARQRFARDLRHHYTFCRRMAQRFQGQVIAWEPWNEANIQAFGGHTIDEMCSLQKAAYLGFKAGDPQVKVCWNVYAGSGTPLHRDGILANEAWPYFETYNIHSYRSPEDYLDQFQTARQAATGRPIWITECGIRLPTNSEPPWGDLTPADQRRQAEFVARSYAQSLYAGANRHFFFILGNYLERGVQFGLLRHDLSPRPGYLALAAVGRFLAGGECLGRLSPTIYAFRARPDGVPQDVLVAWGDQSLPRDLQLQAVYDHLGRPLEKTAGVEPSSAAKFVILPPGTAQHLALQLPPDVAPPRTETASPVVLQLSLPQATTRLSNQAHEVDPAGSVELPLFVYNLSDRAQSGTIHVTESPDSWRIELPDGQLQLESMARQQIPVRVTLPAGGNELVDGAWIRFDADFGSAGQAVLAFRLVADLNKLQPTEVQPLSSDNLAENWQDNIVSDGRMSHRPAQPSGTLFEMQFAKSDPWGYPRLPLSQEDVPSSDMEGLALTVQMLEGSGTVRVQFVEADGAAYLADAGVDCDQQTPQRVVVLFRDCQWGPHSPEDSDNKLQPTDIRSILVGINSKRDAKVRMQVRDLEWMRFRAEPSRNNE